MNFIRFNQSRREEEITRKKKIPGKTHDYSQITLCSVKVAESERRTVKNQNEKEETPTCTNYTYKFHFHFR